MRPPLRDDEPPDTPHTAAPPDPSAPVTPAAEVAADPPADLLDIFDPIPAVDTVDNPFGLSPRELLFVEAFVGAAHFRAAKAYELAGYKVTGAASRANASRMLTRPRVAAAITSLLNARCEQLRIMDGDEALEGISNMGRVDIRKAFPHNRQIQELPDDIADAIKSIRPTKWGIAIEVYDKMHARETMAKVAGKLKDTLRVEHTLEDILAASNRLEPGASA